MLQGMNKVAKSWVASIFLGALALSFGVWGIADVFKGGIGSDTTVATVGGTEISRDAFQSEYDRSLRSVSQQSQMTPEMARAMGVPQRTLRALIGSAALNNVSSQMGVTVSDEQVKTAIQQQQFFQNATGQYDYNIFLSRLQAAGYTEREYMDVVRRGLMTQQLTSAVQSNFKLPTDYIHTLYDFVDQTRAADFVVVSPTSIGNISPPSDQVLADYLKKNADRFSTPEYRNITFAAVTPADVKDQVEVPEQQVDQAYEARKDSYSTPEKRDIEQITYPDEAAAKAARAKIAAGESFADAAKDRGLKPTDIELGELVPADLPGERGKIAFSLTDGAVSQPIKDTFGWMLLRVTKIIPGTTKDEAVAKSELRQQIATATASAKIDEIVNALQDALAAGDDLPTAAKKVGMKGGKIAAMDSKGLTPDGKPSGAPTDPDFLTQAFKAEVGEDAVPFRTANGSAYAVKVEGVVPPKPRPLADVRDAVLADWMADERGARLKAKAEELAAQAKKDNSLSGIANVLHVAIQKSPGLRRSTVDQPMLSSVLINQLFEQPAGGIAVAPLPKGEGYVVARVTGIAHPAQDEKAPAFTALADQVSAQAAGEMPDLLVGAELARSKVTTNQQLLDQIVGEGQ